MNQALLSSKKMDWCTPQSFYDVLHQEFNFTLDVAATDRTTKCPMYFTPETDGLNQSWNVPNDSAVFCNPPYGREIGKWVKKACEEAQNGTTIMKGCDGLCGVLDIHPAAHNKLCPTLALGKMPGVFLYPKTLKQKSDGGIKDDKIR